MVIVENASQFTSMQAFIAENSLLAFDIETTGLNVRKDRIIGFGVSNKDTGFYFPILTWNKLTNTLKASAIGDQAGQLLLSLKEKQLICHNAAFDIVFTKNAYKIDLLPNLHADTMLLKHTCDEEFPFGLKEIAVKLWGLDVKKEKEEMQASIKSSGGKPTEYYKASTETLAKYCIQDCVLTMRVYAHYSVELRRQGLESFYYTDEVLPLYKEVVIPMSETGVKLDVSKMEHVLVEIKADIAKTERSIQEAIAPNLSLFQQWFLNKDYPPQTATGKTPAWAKKGFTQYQAWQRDYPDSYMFNLQSKHHLKKLFFDTLKETPLSRTPTGLPQVDEEFLEVMAIKYDWCKALIEYNKLNKIKSTYIERLLEEAEDGRIYPSWLMHRTISGRLGGDLQQLPRLLEPGQASDKVIYFTNQVRSFIIPDSECELLSADYEQLEPSVFSHTSGDAALQAIFKDGKDFYSEVAIRTENIKTASSDKQAPNYLGRTDKAARQKAKSYSLGIAYGLTAYKLKFELNVSEQDADRLVNDYLSAFPDLASWMHQSKESVKYKGQIATQAGRIRHMPRAAAIFKKYGACIDNDLQLWKQYNQYPDMYTTAKADRREYKNLLNNAINFQVQGLAASIVNRASIAIARKLKTERLESRIIMQVHDELVLNVPQNEKEVVAELVQSIMQSITKLAVPLRTLPQFGTDFAKCK